MSANGFTGLAIECSGSGLAVGVFDQTGTLAHERARTSEQEHARHLTSLIADTLAASGSDSRSLDGIAIDVGPGSFTALRVGLATARGLAQPHDTPIVGVTAFAALLEGRRYARRLVVPLVIAGRNQLYAGFFRGDPRGELSLLRGPAAGTLERLDSAFDEALALCPRGTKVLFMGPGAVREREALEERRPGSTDATGTNGSAGPAPVEGAEGPTLASVARLGAQRLAGGRTAPGAVAGAPLYVRAPQAVERAPAIKPMWADLTIAPLAEADLPEVLEIEKAVFSDPWPRQFFVEEMKVAQALTCVVRHRGRLAGYLMAWRLDGELHLGNLAVAPDLQRRGIGQYMLEWLFEQARASGQKHIALEVRASNFAAQELYRRHGFRAVALRHGYYQDTGEDALVMLRDLP